MYDPGCTIACLSFIPLYKQKFYKCYSLSLSKKSEESKNYHSQYLVSCLQYLPLVFLSFGGSCSLMGISLRFYSYHDIETNGVTIYTQLANITLRPGEGSTLGIFGWERAAGTLEPLTCTSASSSEFCYPILD